ncbi:MAG: hypothetical protein NT055_00405, partial [Nitrospirae bacterium]|nr:hypothetical protein [Nitrospirota bacterium]
MANRIITAESLLANAPGKLTKKEFKDGFMGGDLQKYILILKTPYFLKDVEGIRLFYTEPEREKELLSKVITPLCKGSNLSLGNNGQYYVIDDLKTPE